jgi:hypothetical protein
MIEVALAAALVVYAVLPVAAASDGTREAFREILRAAGCRTPIVTMRVADGQHVEIEVTCREEGS